MKLLCKEFRLCMHPAAWIMLLVGTLVLVPNYPYSVCFFYMTLGIFFICLTARENHDAAFTLTLPVSRAELVRGRVCFAACLELAQLLVCAALIPLRQALLGDTPNAAGLDANVALFGEGFLVFGLFNAIFFPCLYRDINKVGVSFVKASVAVFVWIVLEVVATYTVPFVRDALDTPDPAHLGAKLGFLAVGAAVWVGLTALALRASVKRFEAQDLQL